MTKMQLIKESSKSDIDCYIVSGKVRLTENGALGIQTQGHVYHKVPEK